ncbi:hypothetical protein MHK_009266, partial [Candidatus Magnetomorum sp. HK-1]
MSILNFENAMNRINDILKSDPQADDKKMKDLLNSIDDYSGSPDDLSKILIEIAPFSITNYRYDLLFDCVKVIFNYYKTNTNNESKERNEQVKIDAGHSLYKLTKFIDETLKNKEVDPKVWSVYRELFRTFNIDILSYNPEESSSFSNEKRWHKVLTDLLKNKEVFENNKNFQLIISFLNLYSIYRKNTRFNKIKQFE